MVEKLKEMDVKLVSLKEHFQTGTPQGDFFLTIVAAFSQLEVEMCRSRVRDGLEAAKRRGKTLGETSQGNGHRNQDVAVRGLFHQRDLQRSRMLQANPLQRDSPNGGNESVDY